MEDLINNASVLFDENSLQRSPPLPPTPVGEPVPMFAYGTSHTKVASVPATPQEMPGDFTPRLPPRPANSIHPSLRAGTSSPAKERKDVPPSLPPRPEQRTDGDTPPTEAAHVDDETESSTLNEQTSVAVESTPASESTLTSESTLASEQATLPQSRRMSKSSLSQLDNASSSSQLSTESASDQSSVQPSPSPSV